MKKLNILFLTLLDFSSFEESNIYTDLLREVFKDGHNIYAVSPTERKNNEETKIIKDDYGTILKVKIGNIQKTNIIEKGISTLLIDFQFTNAIKHYLSDTIFDLVVYSTPPITLIRSIEYVKKRDNASSYLLLKDIFPQNAVDLGMLRTEGMKSIIYDYFRSKEKKLYNLSDKIGCMSPANQEYILTHNPELSKSKVELFPNCIEVVNINFTSKDRNSIRAQYGIPLDKRVFIYGGNLGKPQGIDFLISCLNIQLNNKDNYFVIIGNGTEYNKLENFFEMNSPQNMQLRKPLPKTDYESLVRSCDVGMLFLDYRFTIPNFPSRLLSYMQAGIPVLACTDNNTDIGQIITEGDFGWWCESTSRDNFLTVMKQIDIENIQEKGNNGKNYLVEHYNVKTLYKRLIHEF